MFRKLLHACLLGSVAGLIGLGAWYAGALRGLEALCWGLRVDVFAARSASTDKIKVILLDQASLDWGASEQGWSWPWPRQVYAPIIDFCRRGGAKAIAFDVLFTESSAYGVEDDQMLGQAFTGLTSVAAVFLGRQAEQQRSWPAFAARPTWLAGLPPAEAAALSEPGAAFPVPEIATNASVLANVKDIPDPDSIFRRAGLFRVFDGVALPSLGLAALLAAEPAPCSLRDGWFSVGTRRVPVDGQGRLILRFRGPSGTHGVRDASGQSASLRAAAVIQSELRLQEGGTPVVDPAVVRDCYVFVGFSAPGLKDLRPTPISGDYPGVEIHATLLDNLLAADPLRDVPPAVNVLGTLLMALLAAMAVMLSRNARQNVVAFAGFVLVVTGLGLGTYAAGWWWPVAPPALGGALALVGGVVWNYATEGRQKRFIKSAFNQYVGPAVLDELVAHPEKLSLGGEKRELTMFFSDLEKFSSFSEKLEPPRLIELLNVYLTEMGAILKEEGAYLDKFVGDAIVAFWNAPVRQADHAARAVRAAVRCQRRCAEMRPAWERQFGAVVRTRIGLNTGDVVVGNMGSLDKFNYTMLGDAANTASRLEGANKAFGTFTMVAEATWLQVNGLAQGRELGAITVVGRKQPIRVFEPLVLAGEALPAWVAEFTAGLEACRARQWTAALACFMRLPDDPAARAYAARCRDLVEGRLAHWDGIWNLTEK
ncbi:MAG: adenylate/guanylate cyclase domain-containing protein [Lentisphaerae bacterium]|nr:adenylate/guanylate cyclase domain-containing protein [Lentisphaerota bacterium]